MLWERSIPWQEDHGGFNAAKTWGRCDGRELTLYSQLPYWAATFIQTFAWNGQELRYLSHDFADASADILEAAIVAIETQGAPLAAPEGLESPFEGLIYPQHYIHGDSMAAAIARGHATALARYEAGETEVAAKILWEMFELTRSLHSLVGGVDELRAVSQREKWLHAWLRLGMVPEGYRAALNDYDLFLKEIGESADVSSSFN